MTLDRRPAALDHAPVYRNWKLPPLFTDLRERLEQRHGPHAGARQYIRVLQLLGEHPVQRVERAIELTSSVADAELICQRVERLASRDRFDPESPAPMCAGTNQVNLQVPLPDLGQFNQLLSEGAISHEETCGQPQS